jgi:uncharacterized protein YkwD
VKTKTKQITDKKRHGHHQRRSKRFHSVYLPYLPLLIAVIISLAISSFGPSRGTLAYATEMSISGLLQSTNQQRIANGQKGLTLNQELVVAAQNKANDMVARNYWSHNTPDGQEPWVFIDNAGYKYLKAGENLAYGFATSNDTVSGWMNSPSHRENLLDSAFSEVGFGYANSSNFNSAGNQTVVVAMYGKPQTLGVSSQQPLPPTPAPQPVQAAPTTPNAPSTPAAPPTEQPITAKPQEVTQSTVPFSTDMPGLEPASVSVSQAATITRGQAPWLSFAIGIMAGLAMAWTLLKHGLALRHLLRDSERFVLKHTFFDMTLVGLAIIGLTLLRTAGIIL